MVLDFPISNGVFNGVLKYLSKTNQKHRIEIKSSGKYGPTYYNADHLLNIENPLFYTEKNSSSGQWIKFWFKNDFVLDIEGYSLRCIDNTECANSRNKIKWKI